MSLQSTITSWPIVKDVSNFSVERVVTLQLTVMLKASSGVQSYCPSAFDLSKQPRKRCATLPVPVLIPSA